MALSITLTHATVQDLHHTALSASQAGDHAAVRRALALVPYAAVRCVATVAADAAVHCDSIYSWLHTLLAEGVAGLRSAPKAGRPAKLTGDQKARLRALLLAGPEAAGYPTGGGHSPSSPPSLSANSGCALRSAISRRSYALSALATRRRAWCPISSMTSCAASG